MTIDPAWRLTSKQLNALNMFRRASEETNGYMRTNGGYLYSDDKNVGVDGRVLAINGGIGGHSFGSATIHRLKELRLIVKGDDVYRINQSLECPGLGGAR